MNRRLIRKGYKVFLKKMNHSQPYMQQSERAITNAAMENHMAPRVPVSICQASDMTPLLQTAVNILPKSFLYFASCLCACGNIASIIEKKN